MLQDSKQFKKSFIGYNRNEVDAEFQRLITKSIEAEEEKQSLRDEVDSLSQERADYSREQLRLGTQISELSSHVVELEGDLSRSKLENDTLNQAIEAHKAEKSAMQIRYEHLRERDRDFSLREREFSELQSSVASIMSVTKRATDRLFQKSVENQERITQIAGDAAREVAAIRADMSQVRQQLNAALDEVQDRIDRVDASLTGAVHKLVAIKHDDGLQVGDKRPDVINEVESLLSMRPGEVDYSDGKAYSAPVLGPYSAKFLADTAQRVNDGRITAKPVSHDENGVPSVDVKRVSPTPFESSEDSILEANKLLERGGMSPEEYYENKVSQLEEKKKSSASAPIKIGFVPDSDDEESVEEDDGGEAIPLAAPAQVDYDSGSGFDSGSYAYSGAMQAGDSVSGSSGYECYPVRSYSYHTIEQPSQPVETPAAIGTGTQKVVQPVVRWGRHKVNVHVRKGRR